MGVQDAQQTRAIVLAGVHLWEESAFDNATPRPLLPVGHQPLICHVLGWLHRAGIRQATICANSTSRFIRKCLGPGDSMGMDLDYYEDWTPRGPAGCARDAAQGAPAERYIVADGTILPQVDAAGLLAQHRAARAAVTIAVSAEPAAPHPRQGRLSPVGIYVFEREALERTAAIGYQDIKEVLLPRLHADGLAIAMHLARGPCPRVSGLYSYLAINEWLLEHLVEQVGAPTGYRPVEQAWVHRGAQVHATARLIGPVLVGAGSRIGADATVLGPCVIGADCLVDAGAVLCRSVVWDACRIGRAAVVDRCVLTHQARVSDAARLYDQVRLPTWAPGRLLAHLGTWTGHHRAPSPASRTTGIFDPAAVKTRKPSTNARTAQQQSLGASTV